jgi:transcription elongation factor SPT6
MRLDYSVNGLIPIKNLSDQHVLNPEDRVRPGQRIYVGIIKIIHERFQVDCISKSSVLRDENWDFKPVSDSYYDDVSEQKDNEKQKTQAKAKAGSTYIRRVIVRLSQPILQGG